MITRKAFAIGLVALLITVCVSDFARQFVWQDLFNVDFESQGIQEGAPVSNLVVAAEHGEHRPIALLWETRPLLLVTASLTCPVSRKEIPHVEELRRKFGERVSIVVLYTQEAHPITGPFPYGGDGEQPEPNRIEGIARAQPRTLAERAKLAAEFRDHLGISVPIMLDEMDNRAWKSFGGGSNMALLIGKDGVVQSKQGWFDVDEMNEEIANYLGQ